MNKYNEKLEAAKSLVVEYYTALYDKKVNAVDKASQFAANLVKLGAISEDGLSLLTHEDILIALAVEGIPPKVLAKQIANVFRSSASHEGVYVSSRRAEAMNDRALIEAYDPQEPANAVGTRLKALSRGGKFLVFENGKVLVEDSLLLLTELRQGYDSRTQFKGKKVFPVGDMEQVNMVNENPLYPGKPLRTDDYCDITGFSWKAIDEVTRQLVRFILDRNGFGPLTPVTIGSILEWVRTGTIESRFLSFLPDFNQAMKEGKAPLLKVNLTKKPSVNPVNNPLAGGKKVC